jgi:SAM-dependent methyltransferase
VESEHERLRATFDNVAEGYRAVRPRYPDVLIDDVCRLGGLGEGSRLAEIGCGTGQATVALAKRGLEIECVELGEHLAAVARQELAGYPRATVITVPFEEWQPSRAGFDAVAAFTSLHWIDPAERYRKPAALLRPGGRLAVVKTVHVLPAGGDPFFVAVDDAYVEAGAGGDGPPPLPEEVEDMTAEIVASGLFHPPEVRRYRWDAAYTAEEYLALLDTYSGHMLLEEQRRRRLYDRIRGLIESTPRRSVTKSYLFILHLATRI